MPRNDELREGVEAVLAEMRANPALVDEMFPPSPRYFTAEHLRRAMTYLTARAERAEAAIAAVRALHEHRTMTAQTGREYIGCVCCGWVDGEKCPTIAALDSTDPPKPEAEIWIDRGRMGGLPCVYGSRLPIETLVRYADACGDAAALEAYPPATVESLAAARWFLTQWRRSTDPVEAAPKAVIVSDGRGGKTIAEEHGVDLPRGPAAAIRRSERRPTRPGTRPDAPAPGRCGPECSETHTYEPGCELAP